MGRDFFGCRAFVVGEDLDYPIKINLNNPREVGADRVVNAVAAAKRYKPPLIIVDFGTATTFDVVNDEGSYCGGAIAPGINLSLEALHRAAAKLPRIAVEPPESVIGTSTISAMQSGVFWGYVGLIEGLVGRIQAEYGEPMTVIATGGLAPLFARRCPVLQHIDRDLTMAGLLEMYMHQSRADPLRKGTQGVRIHRSAVRAARRRRRDRRQRLPLRPGRPLADGRPRHRLRRRPAAGRRHRAARSALHRAAARRLWTGWS